MNGNKKFSQEATWPAPAQQDESDAHPIDEVAPVMWQDGTDDEEEIAK